MTYEFDAVGNWTKETIQRWTEKNGALSLMETVVSRERQITYHSKNRGETRDVLSPISNTQCPIY